MGGYWVCKFAAAALDLSVHPSYPKGHILRLLSRPHEFYACISFRLRCLTFELHKIKKNLEVYVS